jgi:hypothetical protein
MPDGRDRYTCEGTVGAVTLLCSLTGTIVRMHGLLVPPRRVETALELVPYLVIAALAWRLWKHHPFARGSVVAAREGGL